MHVGSMGLYTIPINKRTGGGILKVLDKDKLLDFMGKRKEGLYNQITRDFGGGLGGRVYEHSEVKVWKEAIERGEFDSELQELYIVMHGYGEESRIVDFTFYTDRMEILARVSLLNELEKSEKDNLYWAMTIYSNYRNSENVG